jgi:hypothetical protein
MRRKARPAGAGKTKAAAKKTKYSKSEHITEERIFAYINYQADLNDNEEEHLRSCALCNDRFRMICTSGAKTNAA